MENTIITKNSKIVKYLERELLNIINSTDNKQIQEALIFKFLYQIDSKDIYGELMSFLSYQDLRDVAYASRCILTIKGTERKYYHLDKYSYLIENYYQIIDKFNRLAKTLNLTNSLEICILFSYLVYNGYLSFNHQFNFETKNRLVIPYLYGIDIILGNGVCMNLSEMLTDIMNRNGYLSAVISNYYNFQIDIDYKIPKLDVKTQKVTPFTRLLRLIDRNEAINYGNHACTLIFENNNLYFFDTANLTIYKPTSDNRIATNVIGTGEIYLKPYFSYNFVRDKENKDALEKYCLTLEPKSPYDRQNFIDTSKEVIDKIQKSNLLDIFYEEIKPNIEAIVKYFEKSKSKTRKISKK